MKPIFAAQPLLTATEHLRRERERVLGYKHWWYAKEENPRWSEEYDYGWKDAVGAVTKLFLAATEDLSCPIPECGAITEGAIDLREHLAVDHTAGELADLLTGRT